MQSVTALRERSAATQSRVANKAAEYEVNAWRDAMQKEGGELHQEAKLLWDFFGGSRSKAKSFWISKDAVPRCNIESFALSVAAAHLPDGYTGAEFWVQYREGDTTRNDIDGGLDFHFDKDEEALTKKDIWKHPAVSTVTYLSPANGDSDMHLNVGAPLVVFGTTSEDDFLQTRLRPRQQQLYVNGPRFSWVVPPVPGLHVAFNGSLLHGVPCELNPLLAEDAGESAAAASHLYQRLSLPVNIWVEPHTPSGVQTLSDDFIKMLHKAGKSQKCSIKLGELNPSAFLDIVSNQVLDMEEGLVKNSCAGAEGGEEEEWYQLSEHVSGDTAELPLQAIRETIARNKEQLAYSNRMPTVPVKTQKQNQSKAKAKDGSKSTPIHCGVRVEYRQPARLPVIVVPPKWLANNL
jgi:hypothetical protein